MKDFARLPAFDKYKKKCVEFAKALRYKVVYKANVEGEAEFSGPRRQITVDEDMTEPEIIASILHELGHAIDAIFTQNWTTEQNKAYDVFYDNLFTQRQKNLVVAAEIRAWDFAEELAVELGIPLGKWFFHERKVCLKGYKEAKSEKKARRSKKK